MYHGVGCTSFVLNALLCGFVEQTLRLCEWLSLVMVVSGVPKLIIITIGAKGKCNFGID